MCFRIPKGCLKKRTISEGEGVFTEMEFRRHGGVGVEHFGISEGKEGGGGGKISMPPVVWYGYFLESPIRKRTMNIVYKKSTNKQKQI